MTLASLTVEQLHDRFFLEEAPQWWLYNATRTKEIISKYREDPEYTTSEEERLLDSWMQLEEVFRTIPYGRGKIVLKKNKGDNLAQSPTLYVQWGAAPSSSARPAIGSTSPFLPQASTTNDTLYLRMMDMQEKAHSREMDMMKSVLEHKFEIEKRDAEIEGMGGSTMSEDLLRGFVDIAKTMVMRPVAPAAALGTLGQGGSHEIPQPQPTPAQQAEGEQPGHRRFSLDKALQDIQVIRAAMPEYNINDVLEALALYTRQQPDQAKNLIGMLMPNQNG